MMAGQGSYVPELDEKHAHVDGGPCGLTLHDVMVVQGVVEHVNIRYLHVVVVSLHETAVYMVQHLLLMAVMK